MVLNVGPSATNWVFVWVVQLCWQLLGFLLRKQQSVVVAVVCALSKVRKAEDPAQRCKSDSLISLEPLERCALPKAKCVCVCVCAYTAVFSLRSAASSDQYTLVQNTLRIAVNVHTLNIYVS